MLCIQKNRILIKHYQLIITLESTIFECKMNQQIISIKGKNIEIRYYSQDEIMLMGEFTFNYIFMNLGYDYIVIETNDIVSFLKETKNISSHFFIYINLMHYVIHFTFLFIKDISHLLCIYPFKKV